MPPIGRPLRRTCWHSQSRRSSSSICAASLPLRARCRPAHWRAHLDHRHLVHDEHARRLDARLGRRRQSPQRQLAIAFLRAGQQACPGVQRRRPHTRVVQQACSLVRRRRDMRRATDHDAGAHQRPRQVRLPRPGLAEEQHVLPRDDARETAPRRRLGLRTFPCATSRKNRSL